MWRWSSSAAPTIRAIVPIRATPPYDAVAAIRGHLAFYPDAVEIVEIDDGEDADTIRDIIEHTDSGSGRSQLETWPATATVPHSEPAAVAVPFKETGSI